VQSYDKATKLQKAKLRSSEIKQSGFGPLNAAWQVNIRSNLATHVDAHSTSPPELV